jgi:RimJ/RimL family protein N-acetyltransferase
VNRRRGADTAGQTDRVDNEDVLFETERLVILRRWRPGDLEDYALLNADPVVTEHLNRSLDRQESDAFAAYGQGWYDREKLGLLPVVHRQDGVFLGMCGMHRHRWFPDEVEIGWRLARHAWGRGYATEAAARWMDHGVESVGLDHVISITNKPNVRSQALMRRLGMTPDTRQLPPPAAEGDIVLHSMTAEQWRAVRHTVLRPAPGR